MTPEMIAMIDETAGVVREDPDRFGDTFYATLFELAPHTRALFPDDITEQRLRLVNELTFLVEAATDTDRFTTRARALGERHAGYGVKGSDFEPVRHALLAALREQMDDAWTLDHERSWTFLYELIADVMREGASERLFD